jgi:hypothetical protein
MNNAPSIKKAPDTFAIELRAARCLMNNAPSIKKAPDTFATFALF